MFKLCYVVFRIGELGIDGLPVCYPCVSCSIFCVNQTREHALFYASSEITVLATSEAIHLVIQIPLRSERRTYSVYNPVPLPTFEVNLGKFIQIRAGEEKLAVSSDRRSYMILPAEYIQNCRQGIVTICEGIVPVTERVYETCLSRLFFGTSQGYTLCTREILMDDFRPVFRRLPFENSWLYSVAKLTRVECKCVSARECPTNTTSIEGTGILQQPEGCDLVIGQLTLPASRQYESKADWGGPEVIIPQMPDLLLPEEVSYVKQHQALLEDVWDAWEGPGEGEPDPSTVPITMSQLQRQV
jgi:hypothetical protein